MVNINAFSGEEPVVFIVESIETTMDLGLTIKTAECVSIELDLA